MYKGIGNIEISIGDKLITINELKNKILRHFKGNYYLILDIAEDVDSGKKFVFYRALYENTEVFCRELKIMFSPAPKNDLNQLLRYEIVELPSKCEYKKGM